MPRSIFFRSIMRVPSVLSLIGYVMLKSKFSAFRNVFGNVRGQSVKNTILTNVVLCVCKYMYIWIYFFLFYSRPFEPIAVSILPLCLTMNFLHSQFLRSPLCLGHSTVASDRSLGLVVLSGLPSARLVQKLSLRLFTTPVVYPRIRRACLLVRIRYFHRFF